MAKGLGVGTVYLTISNLILLIADYGISIGLAYFLGPETYGIFGILTSLYFLNRAFLNTGVPRSVSKFIAESEDNFAGIMKTSMKLQIMIAGIFGLCYVLLAPLIAFLLKDSSLQYYIMFLGLMVIPLAIFPLHTSGFLNGLRLFKLQSVIKLAYPLLRFFFVFLFVIIGLEIWGVLFGYFLALIFSIIISNYFLKKKIKNLPTEKKIPFQKILRFSLPITLSALGFNIIKNVNILFLKSFVEDYTFVGIFAVAMTLSNVTPTIFYSLPTALMPAISHAAATKDHGLIRKYISQSLRYLLLIIAPITALIAATSKEIIKLLYPSSYMPAAALLSILIFSSFFLTIFLTLTSAVSGSGTPKVETMITVSAIPLIILLNIILIPFFGAIGAAISMLITSIIMVIVAWAYVFKKFKATIPSLSLFRMMTGTVVIFLLTLLWNFKGLMLVVGYGLLFLVYGSLLILLGEIKKEDYRLVRRILIKKRKINN